MSERKKSDYEVLPPTGPKMYLSQTDYTGIIAILVVLGTFLLFGIKALIPTAASLDMTFVETLTTAVVIYYFGVRAAVYFGRA